VRPSSQRRAAFKKEWNMPISYEDALRLTDEMERMDAITEAIMALPQITEDEWEERYGWARNEFGNCELLEDTPAVRALLVEHDCRFVWSQIDGGEADRGLTVPGFLPHAIGWYLCERPWDSTKPVVAVIGD
jgi:hypothetical protein